MRQGKRLLGAFVMCCFVFLSTSPAMAQSQNEPRKKSSVKREQLNNGLIQAASLGDTSLVGTLICKGADVGIPDR